MYCLAFKPVALPPISFGWTSPSFVTENKDVTRRNWQPVTVRRFKKDAYFLALNKQQRFGGEAIGIGKMRADTVKQSTADMRDGDYTGEGFYYLDERYHELKGEYPLVNAIGRWRDADQIMSVVPFENIEVFPGCKEKYSTDEEIVRCVKALLKVLP